MLWQNCVMKVTWYVLCIELILHILPSSSQLIKATVDQMCCAYFDADQKWDRAKVIDVVSSTCVSYYKSVLKIKVLNGRSCKQHHDRVDNFRGGNSSCFIVDTLYHDFL